jgi:hypothetical protein
MPQYDGRHLAEQHARHSQEQSRRQSQRSQPRFLRFGMLRINVSEMFLAKGLENIPIIEDPQWYRALMRGYNKD